MFMVMTFGWARKVEVTASMGSRKQEAGTLEGSGMSVSVRGSMSITIRPQSITPRTTAPSYSYQIRTWEWDTRYQEFPVCAIELDHRSAYSQAHVEAAKVTQVTHVCLGLGRGGFTDDFPGDVICAVKHQNGSGSGSRSGTRT